MKFTTYFNEMSELRLNSLVNEFPLFDPKDISLFIEHQFGGSDFVDYIFRLIFPEVEKKAATDSNERSLNNFRTTLNCLDSKCLTQLWLASIRFGEIIFKNTYFGCLTDEKKSELLDQIIQWIEKDGQNEINIRSFWKMIGFAKKGELAPFQNKEIFADILKGFENHFSLQEKRQYIEENLDKLECIEPSFHAYEIWTLREEFRNELYDMESILNLIQYDYKTAKEEFETNGNTDNKVIKVKDSDIYLTLEYLVRFFKEMPEDSRFKLWDYFQIHPALHKILHEEERKTFNFLIKDHFKITEWGFRNSNPRIPILK